LEAIPKVGIMFQIDQGVWGDNDQSIPHMLIEGEMVEWVNKIQLKQNFRLKERMEYEDLLHKYIHMFTFNYKGFRKITMEQHKMELLPNAKLDRTKQGRWNPRYITMVEQEFDKLLVARFIRPMETTKWVSFIVFALNKNGKLKVCVNYKVLNKVIKKRLVPFAIL